MAHPPGIILLWRGSLGSIPDGWALCDGTFGTPDLRNRFVVGAGDTYNPDDTGGASNHDHDFTSDSHMHDFPPGVPIAAGAGLSDTTSNETDSGTTDPKNHLPPYYALAYIMLL